MGARLLVVVTGVALAALVAWDGSPLWRVARTALVLGLTALVLVVVRKRPDSSAVWLVSGSVAVIVGGGIGLPRLARSGIDGPALVALVALAGGVVMVVLGLAHLASARRWWWRVGAIALALVGVAVAALAFVPAVMATNVAPIDLGDATPADVGLAYRDVRFPTPDGVELAGWLVPSANGAAVVLRHGSGSTRSAVLDHAAVLAAAGYGVLLTDARGHGESGGSAMDFGWYGNSDIRGAVDLLARTEGVDPAHIGVVGLSMGGEEALGAAAEDPRLRAVVAEGATGRTAADGAWVTDEYGWRGWVQRGIDALRFGLGDVLTDASPPIDLSSAVSSIAPRPVLLVAAGDVVDEQHVAARLAAQAPGSVETWTVPGAAHTGGLSTEPDEWEQRVTGFLDEALLAP